MTAKSSSSSKQEEYKVELWPVSKIKRDPNQPRKIFKQEAIQELAESIKQFGVLKNIEITKDGVIVTGENRWRAAKLAGLKEIPVRVVKVGDEKLIRQLHENIHHIPMQPGDVMRAVDTYRKQGLSLRAIAKKTGKSLSWVQNYAWLFELPLPLREAFEKGASDMSTMRFFTPMALAEKEGVLEEGITKKLIEKTVKEQLGRQKVELIYRYIQSRPKLAKKFLEVDASGHSVKAVMDKLDVIGKTVGESVGDAIISAKIIHTQARQLMLTLKKIDTEMISHLGGGRKQPLINELEAVKTVIDKWVKSL